MFTRLEVVGKEKEILEIIHFESVVGMPCVPQLMFIMCVHVSVCTNVHQGVCGDVSDYIHLETLLVFILVSHFHVIIFGLTLKHFIY